MSGYSEASRQAFKRVNVTAGQEKILAFLRARPSLKPTRGEIATLTRIPINVVTARVHELINDFDPPMLRELPVKNGAHPVELIENAATEMPKSASCGSDDRADNRNRPVTTSSGNALCDARHPSTSPAASRKSEPVRPYIPGRWSMSIEAAKKIAKDSGNAFVEEARKVIATGAYWVR